MGLDSYLMKMPRYNGATARDVSAVESYLSWKEKGTEYTLEEWCGLNKPPAQEYIDFYNEFYVAGEYGFKHITEDVGYWRKANQIHNWFVENVQDGVDDCSSYIVSKEQIEELLDVCIQVKDSITLIDGEVRNGQISKNGVMVDNIEPGKQIVNSAVAEELLPTCAGFFFGSTDYDQWYAEDIYNTIEILERILDDFDFESYTLLYSASW